MIFFLFAIVVVAFYIWCLGICKSAKEADEAMERLMKEREDEE